MTTIDISLPDSLESCGDGLLRKMDPKILQGIGELDHGEARPMTKADWDRLRAQLRARQDAGEQA
jgi:hypothetical protein